MLVGEVLRILLEVQHDLGAALLAGHFLNVVAGAAVAGPAQAAAVLAPGVGVHVHLVRHHEGAVEAHAELADELGALLAAGLEGLHEGLGAGMGDGAEVFHQLIVRHADAVVGNGEGLARLVGGDVDLQRQRGLKDAVLGELRVAQLLQGVGGVGHQLAHEDLAVRVEAVNDDVQELLDFSLELPVFGGCGRVAHSFGGRRVVKGGALSKGREQGAG